MSNRSVNQTVHFPLLSVLFLVFLVLKLCGTIDWSWWWVTAPLWGPLALFFVAWVIGMPIAMAMDRAVERRGRR